MKKMHLIALLIIFTGLHMAMRGQQAEDGKNVYRVTAYKQGNDKVQSVSNTVEIAPGISLYIPNAFTPNGDNLNDTFGATGEGIAEYNMQIFDRWGVLVFETHSIKVQWDGTYNGSEIGQQDTYVYKITARAENNRRVIKTGNVMLLN